MSDEEEDKLRRVIDKWIRQTPSEHKVTRLLLREHLNEITVGSQTGIRKGNQYALRSEDVDFKLRLITLPDTKSGTPHTVPMTDDVYRALLDQRTIQAELQELRGDDYESSRMQLDGRVFVISENREWFDRAKKEAKVKIFRVAPAEPPHCRLPPGCLGSQSEDHTGSARATPQSP